MKGQNIKMDIHISWNLKFVNKYAWLFKKNTNIVKAAKKSLFISRVLNIKVEATEYEWQALS